MNSRVSNCIELHKFWHYSTNLGINSYGRDQIVYQFFYRYLIIICIESIRTVQILSLPNFKSSVRTWHLVFIFWIQFLLFYQSSWKYVSVEILTIKNWHSCHKNDRYNNRAVFALIAWAARQVFKTILFVFAPLKSQDK
jgi:hypothetical protein